MSNLEDVFLKINKEYAPDLFGDLKGWDDSKNSSMMDDSLDAQPNKKKEMMHNSIGHST